MNKKFQIYWKTYSITCKSEVTKDDLHENSGAEEAVCGYSPADHSGLGWLELPFYLAANHQGSSQYGF